MPRTTLSHRLITTALITSLLLPSFAQAQDADVARNDVASGVAVMDNIRGDGGVANLASAIQEGRAVIDGLIQISGETAAISESVANHASLSPRLNDLAGAIGDVNGKIVGRADALIKGANYLGADTAERRQILIEGGKSHILNAISAEVGAIAGATAVAAGGGAVLVVGAVVLAGTIVVIGGEVYFAKLDELEDWRNTPTYHDLGWAQVGGQMCHQTATPRLPRMFMCGVKVNQPDDPDHLSFSMCNDIVSTCFDIADRDAVWDSISGTNAEEARNNGGIPPRAQPSGLRLKNSLEAAGILDEVEKISEKAYDRVNQDLGFERTGAAIGLLAGNGYDEEAYALIQALGLLVTLFTLEEMGKAMKEDPELEDALMEVFLEEPQYSGLTTAYQKAIHELGKQVYLDDHDIILANQAETHAFRTEHELKLASLREEIEARHAAIYEEYEQRKEKTLQDAISALDQDDPEFRSKRYNAQIENKALFEEERYKLRQAEKDELASKLNKLKADHREAWYQLSDTQRLRRNENFARTSEIDSTMHPHVIVEKIRRLRAGEEVTPAE